MNIAVIGAGNVGSGIAKAATAAGHDVVVSAASTTSAQELAAVLAAAARTPGASVVKGFNTVVASRPGDPVENGAPLDAFNAGNGWAWQSGWMLVGPTAGA